MNDKPATKTLEKRLNLVSVLLSVAVLALVVLMRKIKIDVDFDVSFLPPFHALLNSLAAFSLLFALYYVKGKKIVMHQRFVYIAFGLSVLFLLSYVVYHFTTEETRYCMEGSIRYVYFFFLITHVVLAALILPFILFTFVRAFIGDFERHKKMARWVYPIWLYVAVTGPICYFMLRPCY
jgi:putative membrane protein